MYAFYRITSSEHFLLVIKKNKNIQIANELGAAFRGYNIMEYKSEDDSLSILTRLRYPREALKALSEQGYTVEKKNPGIYMITGNAILPTQIIVISQLDEELHFWITKLRKSITKEQLMQVLVKSRKLTQRQIELYIRPYISVLADANQKAMDKIRKEEPDMGNYFKELFKDELEKKWNDGKEEEKKANVIGMLKEGLEVDIISRVSRLTVEQVTAIGKQAALL